MTLVVLDLDGTLVDSAADLALAINAGLSAAGLPQASDARVRSWIGDGVDVLVERAIEGQGGEIAAAFPVARKAFGETYEQHLYDRSRLYDGVPETLDALKAAGFTLVCVTNKKESFALSVLEKAGILDRFALAIGGDTLPRRKPDPLPLLHAAEAMKVEPSKAIMVGDSHHDLSAAVAAGFAFIWASYGYCDDAGPMDPNRYRRIDAFPEVIGALAELG